MAVTTPDRSASGEPAGDPPAYEPVAHWGLIPHGMTFYGDATSVAVDSQDRVYVFNRGPVPMMVFGSDGMFLGGWGEGEFGNGQPGPRALNAGPHGVSIDAEDNLWLVDVACHVIEKRTTDGRLLMTIGERQKPSEAGSGKPFNRPTDAVVHPRTGDVFISDGYSNCAVHRYDADGRHITSWGVPGSRPGEFNTPHGLAVTEDDRVIVCDRENFRLQVFDTDGRFLTQWHAHRPGAIRVWNDLLFVGEAEARANMNGFPNLGHVVTILDLDGNYLTKFGAPYSGPAPDEFFSGPHGLALDSKGDFYGAEVSFSFLNARGRDIPLGEIVSLRKWRRADQASTTT